MWTLARPVPVAEPLTIALAIGTDHEILRRRPYFLALSDNAPDSVSPP